MKPYPLNEQYRLEHDGASFILVERQRGTKGDRWRTVGYYVELPQALWGFINRQVGRSEETLPEALREAVNDARRAVRELRETLKGALAA